MNLPIVTGPPMSGAVIVVPDVPLGTENEQVNVPVALVVNEPLVHLEIVTPSKTNVTVLETEKPVPEPGGRLARAYPAAGTGLSPSPRG